MTDKMVSSKGIHRLLSHSPWHKRLHYIAVNFPVEYTLTAIFAMSNITQCVVLYTLVLILCVYFVVAFGCLTITLWVLFYSPGKDHRNISAKTFCFIIKIGNGLVNIGRLSSYNIGNINIKVSPFRKRENHSKSNKKIQIL